MAYTEVSAVSGCLFVGLGLGAMILNEPLGWLVMGLAYAGAAVGPRHRHLPRRCRLAAQSWTFFGSGGRPRRLADPRQYLTEPWVPTPCAGGPVQRGTSRLSYRRESLYGEGVAKPEQHASHVRQIRHHRLWPPDASRDARPDPDGAERTWRATGCPAITISSSPSTPRHGGRGPRPLAAGPLPRGNDHRHPALVRRPRGRPTTASPSR
jgi:hypothetical protein